MTGSRPSIKYVTLFGTNCIVILHALSGASIPWGKDAYSPYFRLPLFPKIFQTPWKIFPVSPFPKKMFHFHPPKFLMTFLVIDSKFGTPLFSEFQYISPYFGKLLFPPTFLNFSLWFLKIYVFLHTLCVFASPYASHNARTGRPCALSHQSCKT